MVILGGILVLVGFLTMIVGRIVFLVAAFSEGILWGLGCLFLPIIDLFFLIVHWTEAKKGFLLELLGFAVSIIGWVVMLLGG